MIRRRVGRPGGGRGLWAGVRSAGRLGLGQSSHWRPRVRLPPGGRFGRGAAKPSTRRESNPRSPMRTLG